MLNTENLMGGQAIEDIADVAEIQSPLIANIRGILDRGVAEGRFRAGVDPVELYVTIASLCYFPVSNKLTLRAVFKVPVDQPWLDARAEMASDMIIAYLRRTVDRPMNDDNT